MENAREDLDVRSLSDDEIVVELKGHHHDHSPEENALVGELMKRCTPEVDAMLRRTGIGWSDLPDLEQEVFLMMVRYIDRLREPKAFHGWLRQIARRTAINFHTRGKSTDAIRMSDLGDVNTESFHPTDDREDRPLEQILAGERQQILLTALGSMKPNDRLVLQQFYLRGMSLNEIVNEGGGEAVLPLGTVKRRLYTARSRLLELMSIQMAD